MDDGWVERKIRQIGNKGVRTVLREHAVWEGKKRKSRKVEYIIGRGDGPPLFLS